MYALNKLQFAVGSVVIVAMMFVQVSTGAPVYAYKPSRMTMSDTDKIEKVTSLYGALTSEDIARIRKSLFGLYHALLSVENPQNSHVNAGALQDENSLSEIDEVSFDNRQDIHENKTSNFLNKIDESSSEKHNQVPVVLPNYRLLTNVEDAETRDETMLENLETEKRNSGTIDILYNLPDLDKIGK